MQDCDSPFLDHDGVPNMSRSLREYQREFVKNILPTPEVNDIVIYVRTISSFVLGSVR